MEFEGLAEIWNELGEKDPLWAILSHPEMEDGRWAHEQFFRSGQLEIEALMEEITFLDFPLVRGRVLDFGCGVGRLSQALCSYFDEVHGVDVAASMVAMANQLNRLPDKVSYHVNERADLGRFADQTFDCLYSRLVLQHMAPEYAKQYIAEFMRILKVGGLAIFQIPTAFGPKRHDPALDAYLRPSARFNAQLTADTAPLTLVTEEKRRLVVRVQNVSQVAWLSAADSGGRIQINLANHWLRPDAFLYRIDDTRVPIPTTMAPGDALTMEITVTAPPEAGNYLLEIDLVQEQTAWFGNRGSATLRIPVRVKASLSQRISSLIRHGQARIKDRLSTLQKREQPGIERKPRFEMHSLPAAEVLAIVQANGGRVVALQHDGAVGQDWQGYLYFITKRDEG